jgi:Metallo-peptidase family M12
LVRLAAVNVVLLLLASSAFAQTAPAPVLTRPAAVAAATASQKVGMPVLRARSLQLTVPASTLATQPRIVLDLFPDKRVEIVRTELRSVAGRANYIGRITGGGWAYLVVDRGRLTGVIKTATMDYDVRPDATGRLLISEIDRQNYVEELPPLLPANPRPRPVPAQPSPTPPVHDVMVLYTNEVEERHGAGNFPARIDVAVMMANHAYENSRIAQRLRLVHTAKVNYTETDDRGKDLGRLQGTNDGFIDDIHILRDRHAADLVVLFTVGSGSCGQANLAVISSDADDDSAFAVVLQHCIGEHSFAHELGHIAGAHHDTEPTPVTLPPYARGLVSFSMTRPGQCNLSGLGEWRTIMAYRTGCAACNVSCERITNFSNPDVRHPDGRPTGRDGRNNARRLNETAITLEGFRISGQRVSLYEGNFGKQDHVCAVPTGADESIDFTNNTDFRYCDNDEARSLRLFDVPAGRVLRFYDDPGGSTQDDWTEITVKRNIREKLVNSFERNLEDGDVRVEYHRNNGLDGKVSRLQISSAATGPVVDLHEGNDASQNLVCTLQAAQSASVRFPGHPQCDNDEARSMRMHNIRAGSVLTLFDSPDGSRSDDWLEVTALRNVTAKIIPTFERSFTDADVRVMYRRKDGLDGKVSRLDVATQTTGPRLDLHEGNNGTQDLVCAFPAPPALALNFTAGGDCDNDEARSLTLRQAPAGMLVLLFDEPGGNKEDDWTAIETKRALTLKTIGTFERSFEDADVRVVHLRNNGLDGKVSRLEVTAATSLQGVLSFYEGNLGTQNKVCDLNTLAQTVRFKSHAACDNDEARSLVLTQVPPGTRIEVYDNPDCRANDDWTAIEVKRAIFRKTIGSFERNLDDADVKVTYQRDNGLDGKVSCVKIVR